MIVNVLGGATVVIETPIAPTRRTRAVPDRKRQSVHQIRDRGWKAKIRKVERIEAEEDRMWGVIAERVANDPNDVAIPWEVVRKELGLDRPA